MMLISIIVSTYNKPEYLAQVLSSLAQQTDKDYEVIVADDGSGDETKKIIQAFASSYPVTLTHAWQEDKGFRLAASRNTGVRTSTGEYLVFLDGDCIPRRNFVEAHRKLAEKGWFVTGNRVLMSRSYTKRVLNSSLASPCNLNKIPQFWYSFLGRINRILPLITLPPLLYNRKSKPTKWEALRGCNFALWKSDLELVNGFNEDFIGWGYEDSEFAVRLINNKIKRKSGNFSTAVFHLFHKELKTPQSGPNWELLQTAISKKIRVCANGLRKLSSSDKNSLRLSQSTSHKI